MNCADGFVLTGSLTLVLENFERALNWIAANVRDWRQAIGLSRQALEHFNKVETADCYQFVLSKR